MRLSWAVQQSFWDARWGASKIGFHNAEVNPGLVEFWPAPPLVEAPSRVLVPLCGKSLDLAWLAARGHEVIGIEFVASAAEAFFLEQDLTPTRETRHGALCFQAKGITIVVADIFDCPSLGFEPFQWVYDRAALVALEPETRAAYASTVAELCAPSAELLLLSFDHDMGSGPPFSVPASLVNEAYGPYFELECVADRDLLEGEPRFRERGATAMREQFYKGRRRSAA